MEQNGRHITFLLFSSQANLAEATGGAAQQRQRADGLQKELDAAARRNKALERELEQLGREVALLESRVGKGDYNRATTKVRSPLLLCQIGKSFQRTCDWMELFGGKGDYAWAITKVGSPPLFKMVRASLFEVVPKEVRMVGVTGQQGRLQPGN